MIAFVEVIQSKDPGTDWNHTIDAVEAALLCTQEPLISATVILSTAPTDLLSTKDIHGQNVSNGTQTNLPTPPSLSLSLQLPASHSFFILALQTVGVYTGSVG